MAASDAEAPLLVGVETEARAPVWAVSCVPVPDDKHGRFRVLACAGGGQNETPNSLVSHASLSRPTGAVSAARASVGGSSHVAARLFKVCCPAPPANGAECGIWSCKAV